MAEMEINSNLSQIIAMLRQADSHVGAIIVEESAAIAVEAELITKPFIEAHTPVASQASPGHNPGELKRSTTSRFIPTPFGTVVAFSQPATNQQGTPYAHFVIDGHRIVAWGHDTGRMQPPNNYPTRGILEALPVVQLRVNAAADRVMSRILAVIK